MKRTCRITSALTNGNMGAALTAALVALALVGAAQADTKTWTGGTSTNWADAANWTGGAPGDTDDVVIPSGTPHQANIPAGTWPATGRYGSFTVNNGATVVCLGDMTVTNEASGGTGAKRHGIGVTILCTDATLAGTLHANGRGFQSGGPGLTPNANLSRAASHGGRGVGIAATTVTYGQVRYPTALGSAGSSASSAGKAAGGGAVKLDATGTITVNGTVSANGVGEAWYSCGSGGSVWLVADTLAGTGGIQAKGGEAAVNSGAGGGRIALDYATRTFSGSVSAAGGRTLSQSGADALADAQAGSLWEPNRSWPTSGSVLQKESYQYYFPNTNTLYSWSLTVSNAWFEMHDGRAAVTGLTLIDGVFRFDDASRPFDGDSAMAEMTLGGHILLTNRTRYSELHLPAGDYDLESLTVHAKGTVLAGGRPAATNAASGGTGASPHGAGVSIRAGDVSVAANGSISAAGFGFSKQLGNAGPSGGPSHGGHSHQNHAPYGALARPSALGGGATVTASQLRGGGAVKLVVPGSLRVDGTIQANGVRADGYGTAGGSVWIVANQMQGAGAIQADASAFDSWSSDRGGGGRVAIDTVTSTFSGTVRVRQGYTGSTYSNTARTGTVFRCRSVVFGSSAPDSAGPALDTSWSVGGSDVCVYRQVSLWAAAGSLKWTDQSVNGLSNQVNNTATYTITNLPPDKDYFIFDEGVNILGDGVMTNTGASGSIRFSVFLDGVREIEVRNATPIYAPEVQTLPASDVTADSASMNGFLSVTGTPPTTVYLFWGLTDGGTAPGAWEHVGDLGVVGAVQPVTTNMVVATGYDYHFRYAASNEAGLVWSTNATYFTTGGVTAHVEPAVIGEMNETATFSIVRPETATNRAVTVYYAIGGDATSAHDYTLIAATSIVIAAGATSATFSVTSVRDGLNEPDETVTVTVLGDDAIYPAGTPATATLTLTNTPAPATMTTVATGSWTNPAVWDAGFVPGAGQNVTVGHNLTVPVGTYPVAGAFGMLTVNGGASVTCKGDPTAINPASGGTAGSPHGSGVTIRCADATIAGTLHANGEGFQSGGPGVGVAVARPACYGGRGRAIERSKTYGNVQEPTALGSAGHAYTVLGNAAGGGAIKLEATGTITVNGTVSANGNAQAYYSCGSGGSIWLAANTLAGLGSIQAKGGQATACSGAGGGRIALVYTTSTFNGSISAAGGRSFNDSGDQLADAQAGSLWAPNKSFPSDGSLTQTDSYQYYFPEGAAPLRWTPLIVSNAWFEVHAGRVTVSNLTLIDSVLRYDDASRPYDGDCDMEEFSLAGSVLLTNRTRYSELFLAAGEFDFEDLTVHAKGTVVAGGNPVAPNAASGGTSAKRHGAGVTIRASNVTVATNGSLSANGCGFWSNAGPTGGNGYGGKSQQNNAPYGSMARPSALGSGYKHYDTANYDGSSGGGAVKLVVRDTLILNGAIRADGIQQSYGGGGGSVWIVAGQMQGTGTISANASTYADWSASAGGGGRVAIDTLGSTYAGSVSVLQGFLGATYNTTARTGTVFRCHSLVFGSSAPDSAGPALEAAYGVSSDDVAVTRTVTKWGNTLEWSDASARGDGTALNNTAAYTLTGLPASRYAVSTNGVHMLSATTVAGSLTLSAIPLTPDVVVRLTGPSGTVMLLR